MLVFVQEKDLPNLDLEVDYTLYEDIVWPSMAHRVPAFESLKVRYCDDHYHVS